MLTFVFTEAVFFGTLLLAFLYFNMQPPAGPSPKMLDLEKTGFFSLCLFASSFTIWRSETALHRGNSRGMAWWLLLTILLGAVFICGQGSEYWKLFQSGVFIDTNLFASTFFTLTGFHGIHVIVGLLVMTIVLGTGAGGGLQEQAACGAEDGGDLLALR